ncbi:hypothetical protein NP233_g6619 [Leucocoprinus birnbaumii]|uniref:GSKIP domain-containing protein n=1 Tax=Leucocoprinus birnbaumii TaxID=56174 RepID=A0AAD5VQP6_9AGAR|nr:hypothetical protein NP233_g6619 [Leucocoprinus birnbaumii]
MFSTVFKHRFGVLAFFNLFSNSSMSSSFFGQELHRALREQGPAIHGFKIVSASPLQAVARVKTLEGHTLEVLLTQQGYKVDCKPNEGMTQAFETVEDLLHSISPLYAQRRSEALFEALKRLS